MKKIVALMLALVMTVALATPAFADAVAGEHYKPGQDDMPYNKLTGEGETGTVEVHYEVSAKWQIMIPADVVFVETYGLKFLADVEAQQARIPYGQILTLSISSEHGYKMKDIDEGSGADPVPYSVSFIENNVQPGTKIEKVIDWPELSAEVYGDRDERAKVYGEYFSVDPYTTAQNGTRVLSVVGNGNTIGRVTTTLAFYTKGTDTIGAYKDNLTFVANLLVVEE